MIRQSLQFLDRTLVLIACVALIAIMIMTAISVTGRACVGHTSPEETSWLLHLLCKPFPKGPIADDLVISEILFVFAVFLPMSYVQLNREHVNVTIFTDWMSPRSRHYIEIFGLAVGVLAIGLFAAATFGDFRTAWVEGQYNDGLLELPEWPGRLAIVLGLAVFWMRLVLDLISSVFFNEGALASEKE